MIDRKRDDAAMVQILKAIESMDMIGAGELLDRIGVRRCLTNKHRAGVLLTRLGWLKRSVRIGSRPFVRFLRGESRLDDGETMPSAGSGAPLAAQDERGWLA